VLEINDVECRQDVRPLIEIKSSPMMVGKWLFDTCTGLNCLSSQQFRRILIERRSQKLNLNQGEARGTSRYALIPQGNYPFAMEWRCKAVVETVTVFKNLSLPLIVGIDAIGNFSIIYLFRNKSFIFQEELNPKTFQKADLRVVSTLKIPAHTAILVGMETTIGKNQGAMTSGIQAVSTGASMEFSCQFDQPGLVSPDHLVQVMIILQN
jgi:hypothetical protein